MHTSPPEADLIAELVLVRDEGLPKLRNLELPALTRAARFVTLDDESTDHVVVEVLIRRATSRFGGGRYGDAAVALFGLEAGTRGETSKTRRELAAEVFERKYETFRKNQEPLLIAQIASQIQGLCSEQHTRDERSRLERAESPQSSAMPTIWLERFAAYYGMWYALIGLGGDLTAYAGTARQEGRPYDRVIGTRGSEDPGYSQDEQAEGYLTFALANYAHFAWLLRQFVVDYGGQWLLSDADAEQKVANAVYFVWWHSPWNERDDSYLRSLIANSPDQELHPFIDLLRSTPRGRATEQEWFDWAETCHCTWVSDDDPVEYFPTSDHHPGISKDCKLHNVVKACGDYLDLIDHDWQKLADWYRPSDVDHRGVTAWEMYERQPPELFRSETRTERGESPT